jgi:regulator of ribonuclease activity A
MTAEFRTADLCDAHAGNLKVAAPRFQDYGGRTKFCGPVSTIRCFEDNSRVREAVAEPGLGRVLVVDGGGSLAAALVGDLLGAKAAQNGWSGIIVNGCVRDTAALRGLDLGVRALAANPMRTDKRGEGERDVAVGFAGVTFRPGNWVYADEDGIIVAERALT